MEFCTRIANQLMLKQIQKGFGKNIVSSPLSINAALNMMAAGSTGHTLNHMLGFLGSKNIDEIKSKSREMMAVPADCDGRSSENVGTGPILTMINGAWLDQSFPLVPKYKEEVLKSIFKCEAGNVDFRTKGNQAVDEINSWANTASRGLIKEILRRNSIHPDTTLILANALYFKGIWDSFYKFDAGRTEKRKFHLLDGSSVLVPFMTGRRNNYYREFDGFKVLKIPYQSCQPNNFSMYIFLPNERDGLQNLIAKFNSDSGFMNGEYFKLAKVMLAEFWIPKFKFSFGFDVSEVMDDMGKSLSITNPRDMSEMVQNTENLPFFIMNLSQKAYIEVDETGTEAAAITWMVASGACAPGRPKPKTYNFVADHPFVFMIRKETSDLTLFSGAVLNPAN